MGDFSAYKYLRSCCFDTLRQPGAIRRISLHKEQELVRLSSRYLISASEWQKLQRHEQWKLRCYAVGRSVSRGVLTGIGAAPFVGGWGGGFRFGSFAGFSCPVYV